MVFFVVTTVKTPNLTRFTLPWFSVVFVMVGETKEINTDVAVYTIDGQFFVQNR
jgi:hypothetical protein